MTPVLLLAASLMLNASSAETPSMAKIDFSVQHGEKKVAAPSVVMQEGEAAKVIVGQEVEDPRGGLIETGTILEAEWRMREDGSIDFDLFLTLRTFLQNVTAQGATAQAFNTEEYVVSGVTESGKPIKLSLDNGRSLTVTVTTLDPKGATYRQMVDPRETNRSEIDNSPDYNAEEALQRIRGKE